MAFKIIWSPEATSDFDKVIDYLAENWTEREIEFFVKETNHVVQLISKNPYLFRSSEKENIFEAVITKHNLLLYQLDLNKKTVQLLTIFDTRQNPKKK